MTMQKSNYEVNMAFSIDENYVMVFCVALCSLVRCANESVTYNIFVLSKGLSDSSKESIHSCLENKANLIVTFIDVTAYFKDYDLYVGAGNEQYLSESTYYRLCLHNVLKEIDKILYVDADIVFCRDPYELYSVDLKENIVAGVPDVAGNWQCRIPDSKVLQYRRSIGIGDCDEYINAGVILLNLKELRSIYKGHELIEFAASRKWEKHDQDVLNVISEGKRLILPFEWNLIEFNSAKDALCYGDSEIIKRYNEASKNIGIIHYATRKPWKSDKVAHSEEFWKNVAKTPFAYDFMCMYRDECLDKPGNVMRRVVQLSEKGELSNKEMIKAIMKNVVTRIKKE